MKTINTYMRYGMWYAVLMRNGTPVRYSKPAASRTFAMWNLLA